MNQVVRRFDVVEEGFSTELETTIGNPIENPLGTDVFWLLASDLATLAVIEVQPARRAIKSRRWRGSNLLVREVEIGRGGAGGKALQVHVDSLPSDLRIDWYASHGIDLHEKAHPETGETVLVPEQKFKRDALFEKRMVTARWRLNIIKPALAFPKQSNERRAALKAAVAVSRVTPEGRTKIPTLRALEYWVRDYEREGAGLFGLMPKERKDKGAKRIKVSRVWDDFFADHIMPEDHTRIAGELTHYMRQLWGNGERGKRAISEKATTKLIEMSRALHVVAFDALELGRPVKRGAISTQFGVCHVHMQRAFEEKEYAVVAIKRKDNALYQDNYMPHIMRDYSGYKPRDIIVGDVHPVDVMLKREDGSQVYPKAISWMDIATNEIFMVFVFLEKGEGVKREHVAMAFEVMVKEWGLPKLLYLDNGSEYKWDAMIEGFTQLAKLTEGAFSIHDLESNAEVSKRVKSSREAVIRSNPYNAKGKPKIEGAFGNIEKVQFALLPGWTSGDRMSKKTHAKGKDPEPFPGTHEDFLNAASTQLEWYHKRTQNGKLDGRSPNEALRDFINDGWGKTALDNPDVLRLAFAEEHTRVPSSGRVSYKTRHGDVTDFYADELLNVRHKIILRVPAWKPEFVFCFDGEKFLCTARPERTFGVLDPRGAEEGGRRRKYYNREVSKLAKHCALLDLVQETARHNKYLADTPEAPIAATVNTGFLNHMAIAEETARKAQANDAANTKPRDLSQWRTGPNEVVSKYEFAPENNAEESEHE